MKNLLFSSLIIFSILKLATEAVLKVRSNVFIYIMWYTEKLESICIKVNPSQNP